MVISKATMFAPLLEADASFQSEWDAFCDDWRDEIDPPLYIVLGNLARHILARLQTNNLAGLDGVFDVIERWHIDGDAYVKEAATVGLLEGLQNDLSHLEAEWKEGDGPTPIVEPWLRPESRKWWDKLNRFWEGDPTALRNDE